MRVALVHGILDTGKVFGPLAEYLTGRGSECATPSLTPNDGRNGLESLAVQLCGAIDSAWGPDVPIDLIGFSMGGLIARYYLQELGGYRRTGVSSPSPHPLAGPYGPSSIRAMASHRCVPGAPFSANWSRALGCWKVSSSIPTGHPSIWSSCRRPARCGTAPRISASWRPAIPACCGATP